jgi:hypothetical protein
MQVAPQCSATRVAVVGAMNAIAGAGTLITYGVDRHMNLLNRVASLANSTNGKPFISHQ